VKRLLRKLPFAFALAAPLVFAQYSYFIVDTTMAGPPAVGNSSWTTTNSNGSDMLTPGPHLGYGGEVRAVSTGTGGFQIDLATYDCYNNCMIGNASNFTTGYQLGIAGNSVSLSSTWLNQQTFPASPQYYQLTTATIPTLQTGSVIRAICRGDAAGGVDIIVYVNNALVLFYHDTTPLAQTYGAIGFDFYYPPYVNPATTFVIEGDAGPLYTGAPNAIPVANITHAAFTNHVDLQWAAGTEPNGIGVYGYEILRNGVLLTTTTGLSYSDLTVVPSSTYTYTVRVIDYHWNTTDTNVTVNTPVIPTGPYPSATPDGFRTGVKPTGAYWGAGNENIDVMSGNLSFSLPLLKPQARTGWSVPFKLSYDSQIWGQNGSGPLLLDSDVGFGFGWRLLAGSITPIWSRGSASLYVFTDSTGAEYRLDQTNGNIWSSKESTYVYFDANLDVLHFRDGSFWTMGCVSSASEADSGVMYPTVMEDTNGNQIQIAYNTGLNANWANSSSRIHTIQDVRGSSSTYTFTYNSDYPVPHLTSITNSITSGEQYTFAPATAQTVVTNPMNSNQYFATTFLNSITVTGPGVVTSFSYNGSGEMTQAVLPYGGYLKWDYDTVTYSSGVSYREVQHRYLSKDGTAGSQTTYTFSHEPTISTPIHQYTIIDDPGGVGEKYYAFGQSGIGMGLVTQYQGRQRPGPVTKTQNDFTWAQDGVGNSYISSTLTTLDPGQAYQAQSKTTQNVDIYGNVWQVNNYDYVNLSTPARTYNYTYLNTSAYTSRYILNRLLTATVTHGSNTITLASNAYDNSNSFYQCNVSTVPNPSSNWDTSYANTLTRGNPEVSSTLGNTTSYCYNQLGVVTSVTSNGVTTSVTTSNSNSYAAPTQLSVGGLTSSLTWSSFLGLTNDTGPNGDSSSIYFDSFARQTGTTSPFGASTGYSYSSAPYSSSNPATVTVATNGRWTKTTMDGLGRTVKVETGDSSGTKSQTDTVYDSCGCSPTGKMIKQSMPHAPNATPVWTTYTYDGIGRTLLSLAPDGASVTTYTYYGGVVTVFDPTGKWKSYSMDAFGNLVYVTEPDPANSSLHYGTTYTYDLLNNLTQVSMPRPSGTQTRTFVFSGKFLVSATNPENGTVNYTYNSYLKMAQKTDAKGQAIVYTYDTLARLTKVRRYPTGTSNAEDTCQQENYYYDSNPFTSGYSQYSSGRLTAVQYYAPVFNYGCGNTFTEQYSYNQGGAKTNKGLLITRTLQWQGNCCGNNPPSGSGPSTADLESSYTYDNEGRMLSVHYPGSTNGTAGPNLGYAYDTMGRLNTMTDLAASSSIISATSYDPASRLLSITGSSFAESRSYNTMGQLTSLSNNSVNMSYSYSATQNNGKITGQTDYVTGETLVYAYDALNRLASAAATSNSWGQSYGYDGFGNLTDQTVTAGTAPSMHTVYSASTNRQGDCADANGNIGSTSASFCSPYTYDVENRIVSVPGQLYQQYTNYAYAPGNKRVWRGTTTQNQSGLGSLTLDEITFWSVTGQKLATYNVTGDPSVVYFWDNYDNAPTPAVTVAVATSNYYFGGKLIKNANGYIGSDRLGSMGKFYPWGQEKPSATTNGTEKFTGYFRDAETGLDYADQRYHQPGMGRFMTPDPDAGSAHPEIPSSWSRYSYVGGDPINFSDPSGLDQYCGPNGTWMGEGCYMSGGGTGVWDASMHTTMGGACTNGNVLSLLNPTTLVACQIYTPTPLPPPPPAPQPTCSITEYSRATPRQFGIGQHTFIEISDPELLAAPEVLESGPSQKPKFFNPWGNWGSMIAYDPTVTNGTFTDALGTTNISSSNFVASDTGGQDVCNQVAALIQAFNNYQNGSHVPYKPVPKSGSGNYNSNSFTFTLLYDVGLVANGPFSVFPSPPGFGWTPGWGMLVPGLHP